MARTEFTGFGKEVRMKLFEKNMTQTELAALLDCSTQYLYKILVGKRSGKKYIKRICEILGLGREEKKVG